MWQHSLYQSLSVGYLTLPNWESLVQASVDALRSSHHCVLLNWKSTHFATTRSKVTFPHFLFTDRRQVTRICTGSGSCFNRCSGSSITTESCRCSNFLECFLYNCRKSKINPTRLPTRGPIIFPGPVGPRGPGEDVFDPRDFDFGNRNFGDQMDIDLDNVVF